MVPKQLQVMKQCGRNPQLEGVNMRSHDFIKRSVPLVFAYQEITKENAIGYFGNKLRLNEDRFSHITWTKRFQTMIRYALNESYSSAIDQFFDQLSNFESKSSIQTNDQFCVIEFECMFGFQEILVHGNMTPKTVDYIAMNKNGTINYLHFDGEPTTAHYPAHRPAIIGNKPVTYAFYFDSEEKCKQLLSYAMLVKPEGWEVYIDPDLTSTSITEGGWASTKTQNTVITPQVVATVETIMHKFERQFNEFLQSKNLPSIEIGSPCGSATYYKRDIDQQPNKEYGDVDINFHIPEMPGLNNNQTVQLFSNNVKEFCDLAVDYETENGKNVVVRIGPKVYVQVDLVISYQKNKEWSKALAPEWNVKGVLCGSLYSALAEVLRLSFGGHGVQAKTLNGERVKFSTIKGVELHHVTNNKDSWAMDIASYLGCKRFSPRLIDYPGMLDEIRVADIANSIRGIAESLELNGISNADEILQSVKSSYLEKINKVINSSKFDKAETKAAIQKAEYTKKMLADKSSQIARLISNASV